MLGTQQNWLLPHVSSLQCQEFIDLQSFTFLFAGGLVVGGGNADDTSLEG